MKTTPISANFERLVVEPIENGHLATISIEYDEITAFFKPASEKSVSRLPQPGVIVTASIASTAT